MNSTTLEQVTAIDKELNTLYALEEDQISFYQSQGFIKLKHVLSQEVVSYFNEVITDRVNAMNTMTKSMSERTTYEKAFLQLFNLWRVDERIKLLVFSKRLAKIAADLMQVDGVRLYHDQALYKEAGGGITPWHADQYYWPLATDKTVTVWIPLQETSLEMGALEFSAGSHELSIGRDLKISDESEAELETLLKDTKYPHVREAFDVGEVSFHSGWTYHRAGANQTATMRKVMTVIYMDKDMKLKSPSNPNQENDWNAWCPGARVGQVIDTPLNPVLY
jgi:ectoine hydroxylase-related dioxygenase (phytanoyl-CoA dioxygenase family)